MLPQNMKTGMLMECSPTTQARINLQIYTKVEYVKKWKDERNFKEKRS